MNDAVIHDERGPVLVVTLNRPAVRNAIDDDLSAGVTAAFDELERREDLAAMVMTGAGGDFCAGMDLRAYATRPRSDAARALDPLVRRLVVKPVLAAVEGHAAGGGAELALACDLIVAAEEASFSLPEAKLSMVPAGGGLLRFPRRVALELGLVGGSMSATRLYDLGVVARVTQPGSALDVAVGLATDIAANGPLAVSAIKRLLTAAHADAWRRHDDLVAEVNDSEDAHEGVRAFTERRPPRFHGR